MGGNLGAGAAAGNGAAAARAAHQHQRGPAVEVDAPFERAGAIGGERGVRLRRQQAGQDDAGAGRGQSLQRRGQALQRSEQNIGEDEIERRAPGDLARGDAIRVDDLDHRAGAIEPGIGARGAHGGGVDVGREHAPPQGARGGDGEDAAAGAEIENPALLFRARGWGVRMGLLIDLQSRSSASRQPRVVP